MRGHPAWCDPESCTVGLREGAYNALPRHASKEIVIGVGNDLVRLGLTQEVGRAPRMVVSMAWNHSTVALDTARAQQLHEATGALLDLLAPEAKGSDD